MSAKTLFLAWQDQDRRQWFPVGRLDADVWSPEYRFRYTKGAQRAQVEARFPLLPDFPKVDRDYRSKKLFALFQNRVIAAGRPDRSAYLHCLGLPEDADPVAILSVNGGRRVTDIYEVFPKLVKRDDGSFSCRFFVHGARHVLAASWERISRLKERETVYVTLELTNPATGLAVQIQSMDYHMLGWAPRYLIPDLKAAMRHSPTYSARVVRVNPAPVPRSQRLLVEMTGVWNGHEPMRGEDFTPLVP